MQKQKEAKTLSKDFCLILCQILQNAESALLCHYERSICEAKNLKKYRHCERANASVAIQRICEHCEATIHLADSALFLQGGLPRFCFAESHKDEIFLPRFCESALLGGLETCEVKGDSSFCKSKKKQKLYLVLRTDLK